MKTTILLSSALLATASNYPNQIRGGSKKLNESTLGSPLYSQRRRGLGRETQEVEQHSQEDIMVQGTLDGMPQDAVAPAFPETPAEEKVALESYAATLEEQAQDKLADYATKLEAEMAAATGNVEAAEAVDTYVTTLEGPAIDALPEKPVETVSAPEEIPFEALPQVDELPQVEVVEPFQEETEVQQEPAAKGAKTTKDSSEAKAGKEPRVRPEPKGGLSHVFDEVPEPPERNPDLELGTVEETAEEEDVEVAEEDGPGKNKGKNKQKKNMEKKNGGMGGVMAAQVDGDGSGGGMARKAGGGMGQGKKNTQNGDGMKNANGEGAMQANAQNVGNGGGMQRQGNLMGNTNARDLKIQEYLNRSRGQNHV